MLRLAISNIAWSGDDHIVLELISAAGARGVEVAPGMLGGWAGVSSQKVTAYRDLCADNGLSIPSFQAILFGKPELQLLGDKGVFGALKAHIQRVAELAAAANAGIMVLGAPGNRRLLGHSVEAGEQIARDRLRELSEIVWDQNISIGLEAVPSDYGGEIITGYRTSLDIVQTVAHPGLVFHLDAACTWLAGDSLADAILASSKALRHFHISQPQLGDFSEPADYHREAGNALARIDYQGWASIEMRETSTSKKSIQSAIREARRLYCTPSGSAFIDSGCR